MDVAVFQAVNDRSPRSSSGLFANHDQGLLTYLKAHIGIAIFAITTVAALGQDDPNDQAPKPTLADVQHLLEAISGDKSKLRAYCERRELHDETQQAAQEQDAKAGTAQSHVAIALARAAWR